MRLGTSLLAASALLGLSGAASAQLVVSANDGKQLRPGEAASSRTADSVSIIDLGPRAPRVLATIPLKASMIGPPTAVAVASDQSFAIVTAAQGLEGDTIVKDDTVSVIDLANPSAPQVVQTITAGSGATGVSINKARTLALVANTGDDSITVFSIAGKRLTRVGSVRLPYQSRPTDIAISPDGKTALAVLQSGNALDRLAIDGTTVTRTGTQIAPGMGPYGATFSRDGRYAYNTNLGGQLRPEGAPRQTGGGTIGSISAVDLSTNQLANSIDVGMTPEHVGLSPDGKYIAVVVANGSAAQPGSANYNPNGLLKVFRVEGASFTPAGEAPTGQWCQGTAWSNDSRQLLLQCAMAKEIEVYSFDGKTLVQQKGATLKFDARPGSMSTATDR